MFSSLLIANRGEIACRIIATAKKLSLRTIAVYSDADASARHVRLADDAVRIGPASANESYLRIDRILDAAKKSGAEAVHPGYGFLSENAEFAEACVKAGLIFVGPPASAIRAMGSKSAAKALMAKSGVPLTPGYLGEDQSPATLTKEAARIGFPVLIKASLGGGGKGMRRVATLAEFEPALAACKREAAAFFGSEHVLLEKYVEPSRHVEMQVFGDTEGNYVYLFERDCSVQRRHQKVLEEAPAPSLTAERRVAMGNAAVQAARAVGYVGAGTVEFIVDSHGDFSFMEMNTRLQVEHPVTELITGLDLVEWQLRVAAGEPLPRQQGELSIHGHALEARIYAENPATGFLPSVGRLAHLKMPAATRWVRIDSGVEEGDSIGASYDPMIAKLIVWGETRADALNRMRVALAQCEIVGVSSNVEFLGRLVATPAFSSGEFDTSLIEHERETLLRDAEAPSDDVWRIAAAHELSQRAAAAQKESGWPWAPLDGFRLGGVAPQRVDLRHGDERRTFSARWRGAGQYELTSSTDGAATDGAAPLVLRVETLPRHELRISAGERSIHATAVAAGKKLHIFLEGHHVELEPYDALDVATDATAETGTGLKSPMPGKVVAHLVSEGAAVERGQALMVVEAMKMELPITAPRAGVVRRFVYRVGENIKEGVELIEFEEAAPR